MQPVVYTIERAARELGISTNNLFNMCVLGKAPKSRRLAPKERAVILTEDLQEWLKSLPVIPPHTFEESSHE
jgi:hypothetical protein